jgi:hypothetical protein
MAQAQDVEDFGQIIEKIVFDESELEELKGVIKTLSEGKITPKQLKQNLLRCRRRMVEDLTEFVYFFVEKSRKNELISATESSKVLVLKLQRELEEKKDLLETVATKLNQTVLNLYKP